MTFKKELPLVIISALILAFLISLLQSWSAFLSTLIIILAVFCINILAKKISSFYLDSEIEMQIWDIQRFGVKPHHSFKKPILMGIFLPFITKVLSSGYLTWLATLTFKAKPKVHRTARRYGTFAFAEMTEFHIALIATSGILANLIFAIIGYLIGSSDLAIQFTKLNIYFAFYNLIPLSDLDGNKILMGSKLTWIMLGILTLIALFFAIIVI